MIQDIIRQRVLLLDGAQGTLFQQYNLTEADFRGTLFADKAGQMKGNNDILCLTRPDIVSDMHRRYLEAGADIIETNTFSSQRISMEDYGVEDYVRQICLAACEIARKLADEYTQRNPQKPRFVAGSIGPTNKTLSMSPDVNDPAFRSVTFDQMVDAYTEQIDALIDGGVDLLLIETIFDTLNCKAALYAAQKVMERKGREVPIMLSVTVSDVAGRTLSGQTLEAFLASVSHANILSVGLNCSFGARQLKPFLRNLAAKAPYFISAYPNAGLPNSLGQYDQTPEEMAAQIQEYIDEGLVNIIGGCCGTTDDYIRRFVDLIPSAVPHVPVEASTNLCLSGLEPLELTPELRFVNVGERCNVAGSRKFLRLISEKQYDEALSIARKQVDDGAMVIDINMDDAMLDARHEMTTFLNLLMADPDISRVPIMIDSSNWEVILAGLKCVQGKCIVNSISLGHGEEEFVSRAREIRRFGAAVVVMAFDEQGQATTYERKISICQRAYNILVDTVGFNPADIIFDPNVLAVATGMEEHNNYALDFIRATEWIRQNLPHAHVSGGVSNLSFSFRGNNYIREAMHSAFLYHTINVGQDMGIVNPATRVTYSDIPAYLLADIEAVLFNTSPDATDRLIAAADRLKAESLPSSGIAKPVNDWRSSPVSDRLIHAMVKGDDAYLQQDLEEALASFPSPVAIIEGPLMQAMGIVGEHFGSGKMFLPQVVRTARTMKRAVAILQPYIEQSGTSSGSKKAGKVLLATVKGDVHDIGKNIVSVIMACNNFEIIDLGVMVPPEQIVKCAISEQVDVIGLSGLITPSLEEMINVARLLQQSGADIPIMIGGATTSELHTALRIAPVYSAPVVWLKDASQNVSAALHLLHDRQSYASELSSHYQSLRDSYHTDNTPVLTIDEARKLKPCL